MHPAYSVIVFTVASGAGYGLLLLLCLLGAAGLLPAARWLGLTGFAVAYGLITAGLLSSTFHLGHPERAWRALSQWRSSWLSREGVMALLTYGPSGIFAAGWVFLERTGSPWAAFGLAGALCAVVTLYCTGMIYASLKTIRQWHNGWVAPGYVVLGFATGALWLNALALAFGAHRPLFAWLAVLGLLLGLLLKLGYWTGIDRGGGVGTAGSATGLGRFGRVRQLEPPHTLENYVQREMGFQVARKHAHRLRAYAVLAAFIVPLCLSLATLVAGQAPGTALALLAAVTGTLGLLVERWLFFAEARHVVTLFYGAERA